MKNLISNKHIAIIGGGPVGLTAARLLQLKGASVVVYERDLNAQARALGGSLDIHLDTGQKAIKAAGLLEEFYALARSTTERMGDREGNVLLEIQPAEEHLFDRPEIDRPDLRNLLLNNLQKGTVFWDAHAVEVVEDEEKFLIKFASGKTAIADVVIIADGSMSKARKLITESVPLQTGTYCIEGEILRPDIETPSLYPLVGTGNFAVVEDKKTLFVHTKGNGHFNFYASFREKGDWIKSNGIDFTKRDTVEAFLNKLFGNWNAIFQELFKASNEFRGFPLRVMQDFENWKPHKNITLAGDAAHVMPPFGGLGVNLGLLDALSLTENLTSDKLPDIKTAIANYEQRMAVDLKPHISETIAADDRIHTQIISSAERVERMKKMRGESIHNEQR